MQKLGELDKLLNKIDRAGFSWGLTSDNGGEKSAVIFGPGSHETRGKGRTRLEAVRDVVRRHNKVYESQRIS